MLSKNTIDLIKNWIELELENEVSETIENAKRIAEFELENINNYLKEYTYQEADLYYKEQVEEVIKELNSVSD